MKKKLFSVLLALVLVLSFSLVTAVPVAAQSTLEVGADKPYTTIQAAITAAGSGDTILVAAGTYSEEISIAISNIRLLGEDRETTIIDAGGVRWGAIDVTDASHIVISGFTLRNSGATQIQDKGVNITGNSQYITVEDCKIYSDDDGIRVHNNRAEGFHTFRNNIISSAWNGIHLEYTSQNTVTQNTISNATGFAGINLGIGGDDNTVQYNEISGCKYGVNLVMSQGGTSGNVISNNEITNNERGIWWQRNPANVIEYNNIFNNADYNLYAGSYFILEAPAPAENNWWGQDPPEAAKFYGSVDYDPWSASPSPIVPPVIAVNIDIKPGSDPNSINLNSKGVVPVAVLTADDFDASSVDPDTVLFADADPTRWTMEDVDADGDLDMLFHFKTEKLNLTEDSTEATLTGATDTGQPIQGTDTVNIVPKKKGK